MRRTGENGFLNRDNGGNFGTIEMKWMTQSIFDEVFNELIWEFRKEFEIAMPI